MGHSKFLVNVIQYTLPPFTWWRANASLHAVVRVFTTHQELPVLWSFSKYSSECKLQRTRTHHSSLQSQHQVWSWHAHRIEHLISTISHIKTTVMSKTNHSSQEAHFEKEKKNHMVPDSDSAKKDKGWHIRKLFNQWMIRGGDTGAECSKHSVPS